MLIAFMRSLFYEQMNDDDDDDDHISHRWLHFSICLSLRLHLYNSDVM